VSALLLYLIETTNMALPDQVYAHASPLSIGGRSMFAAGQQISSMSVAAVASTPHVVGAATARLRQAGFEILQVRPLTINIAGPPDLFEKSFRTKIVEKEIERPNGPTTTYLDSPDTETLGLISTSGTPFADVIEGVALESPRILLSESAIPPPVDYWHLRVPADIAAGCKAAAAHSLGITGRGVKVAIVDSGWYRHPYFESLGYHVAPVVLGPGATEPDVDESGHGTGESANIVAIAPECQLLPVKMNFVNTIGAFNAAVALQPDIISCSWGSHTPLFLSAADMALAASVAAAVASGITVIFSAGNGHAGFPGQHPDVISAGGVFLGPDGGLEASNYASAFPSQIYPGRRVPDVCGLVGMRPKAIYIMLPVEPGDNIDVGNAGSIFPDGDQTTPDDGWAAFSGTSAAAPQLAGAAALIKQVTPGLPPISVKYALMAGARDVTEGFCSPVPDVHNGLPAGPGPDDATGYGLLDTFSAVVWAYVMSLGVPMAASVGGDLLAEQVSAYYKGMGDAASGASSAASPTVTAAYLQGAAAGLAALGYLLR
jgi:subtilisin family serine protease